VRRLATAVIFGTLAAASAPTGAAVVIAPAGAA